MSSSDATEIVNPLATVVPLPRAFPPRVIGFDGDDTLWSSGSLFTMTQGRFRTLLLHHVDLPSDPIDARLTETVQRNLALYGYSIKGFMLSMVETAIAVTDGRIPAQDISTILSEREIRNAGSQTACNQYKGDQVANDHEGKPVHGLSSGAESRRGDRLAHADGGQGLSLLSEP